MNRRHKFEMPTFDHKELQLKVAGDEVQGFLALTQRCLSTV